MTELHAGGKFEGKGYQISDGALSAHGAHNHPLWLRKKLPHDVRVEFDCWSTEQRGDLKIELFGDGHSFDPDGGAYMASGYEVIFADVNDEKRYEGKVTVTPHVPRIFPGRKARLSAASANAPSNSRCSPIRNHTVS